MMDEFYAQQQGPAQTPFAFDQMRHELNELHTHQSSPAAAEWGAEFHHAGPGISQDEQARMEAAFVQQRGSTLSPAEFNAQMRGADGDARMATTSPGPTSQYYRQFQGYQFNGGLPFSAPTAAWAGAQFDAAQQQKGKGKAQVQELSDENWEAQFREMESLHQAPTDDDAAAALDDAANRAIDAELGGTPSETLYGDFQSVWEGIQRERDVAAGLSDLDWHNEFDSSQPWSPENSHTTTMPRIGEYLFEPDNPYLQHSDPFAEGKRLIETGGNLSLAALAFEAAVQQNKKHLDAWTELGACQAMNEKETPAIRAYESALDLDDAHLGALMGLAVSYTNEGYDTTAYRTLERWLAAKYPDIAAQAGPTPASSIDRTAIHDRVTSLFITAAQLSPEGTAMDADVQVGLGVLFYGAEEYDKAVDCFTAALASPSTSTSPEHLLWNRLGATLANSGRSEEAINAYERALTINPNFVRARYNLGVSCINIGCFHQAAEHLLGALAMHRVAEEKARRDAGEMGVDPGRIVQNQSTNLFDTLRRVFGQMGRRDLADLVTNGMELDWFRDEFEF